VKNLKIVVHAAISDFRFLASLEMTELMRDNLKMSTHPRENPETQPCQSSEIVPAINFVTSVGAVEESNGLYPPRHPGGNTLNRRICLYAAQQSIVL
jgi:hypothetical protein